MGPVRRRLISLVLASAAGGLLALAAQLMLEGHFDGSFINAVALSIASLLLALIVRGVI